MAQHEPREPHLVLRTGPQSGALSGKASSQLVFLNRCSGEGLYTSLGLGQLQKQYLERLAPDVGQAMNNMF